MGPRGVLQCGSTHESSEFPILSTSPNYSPLSFSGTNTPYRPIQSRGTQPLVHNSFTVTPLPHSIEGNNLTVDPPINDNPIQVPPHHNPLRYEHLYERSCLECIHTTLCEYKPSGANTKARKNWLAHNETSHKDCDDNCPGCILLEQKRTRKSLNDLLHSGTLSLKDIQELDMVIRRFTPNNARRVDLDTALTVRSTIAQNIRTLKHQQPNNLKKQLEYQTFTSHIQLLPIKFTQYLCDVLYGGHELGLETKPHMLAIAAIICKSINEQFTSGFAQRMTITLSTTPGITETLKIINHLGLSNCYSYWTAIRRDLVLLYGEERLLVISHIKNKLVVISFDNVQKSQTPSRAGIASKACIPIALSAVAMIDPDEEREDVNELQNTVFEIQPNDTEREDSPGNINDIVDEDSQSDIPQRISEIHLNRNIDFSIEDSECECDSSFDANTTVEQHSDIQDKPYAISSFQFLCCKDPAFMLLEATKEYSDLMDKLASHVPRVPPDPPNGDIGDNGDGTGDTGDNGDDSDNGDNDSDNGNGTGIDDTSDNSDNGGDYDPFLDKNAFYPTYGRKPITTNIATTRKEFMSQSMFALPIESLNPSNAEDCKKLLDILLEVLGKSNKQWMWVVCDGVPFEIIRNLQLQDWKNNNAKGYHRIILISGFLHEEMTMLKCLMELYNAIGVLEFAATKLHQNSTSLLGCKDTHKTRTVAFTLYASMKQVAIKSGILKDDKWKTNLTIFQTLIKDTVTVGCAFELFMLGVRTKDTELILLARKAFYPLYFAFHHCKYARIVADDTASILFLKRHNNLDINILDLRMNRALLSISKLPNMHQGTDAIQEEINKAILRILGMNNTVSCKKIDCD